MTPNDKLRQSLSEMVVLWEEVIDTWPEESLQAGYIKAKQVLKETEPLPKDVEHAQKYVAECHRDMGFMGSPEYERQKKIIDDYFEPISQKEKEDKDRENYLLLKSKFEGNDNT